MLHRFNNARTAHKGKSKGKIIHNGFWWRRRATFSISQRSSSARWHRISPSQKQRGTCSRSFGKSAACLTKPSVRPSRGMCATCSWRASAALPSPDTSSAFKIAQLDKNWIYISYCIRLRLCVVWVTLFLSLVQSVILWEFSYCKWFNLTLFLFPGSFPRCLRMRRK